MKTDHNIDELFKSKLGEREFDIKPEFLDQLNDQLDAQKGRSKKKIIYVSAIGLLLLLLFTCTGVLFMKKDTTRDQANHHAKLNQVSSKGNSSKQISIKKEESKKIENTGSNQETTDENHSTAKEVNGNTAIYTADTGSISKMNPELGSNKSSLLANDFEPAKVTPEKETQDPNREIEREPAKKINSKADPIDTTDPKEDDLTKTSNDDTATNALASETDDDPKKKSKTHDGSGKTKITKTKNKGNSKVPKSKKNKGGGKIDNSKTSPDPSVDKIRIKENGWTYQIGVGGSYISKNGITGSPESIAIRQTEEKSTLTPQIDLGINYYKNNWAFSSGLSFNQHGENLDYSTVVFDSTFIYYYNEVIDSITLDTTFLPVYVYTSTNNVAMNANKNNRHSYITIPLSLGYKFDLKEDVFSITPRIGIGVRVLVSGKGTYISDGLKTVFEAKDDLFSFSYFGNIEFAYELRRMSIYFAPNYHSTFSTFNSLHRYYGIGAVCGVIFKL